MHRSYLPQSFFSLIEQSKYFSEWIFPNSFYFLLAPEDHLVDFPDVGQSDILNIGFDFELAFLCDLGELFLGKFIFEDILFFYDHFLFVIDIVFFTRLYTRKEGFGKGELKLSRVFEDLEWVVELFDEIVGFVDEGGGEFESVLIFPLGKELEKFWV